MSGRWIVRGLLALVLLGGLPEGPARAWGQGVVVPFVGSSGQVQGPFASGINVTSLPASAGSVNAKCDNVTDDTGAFQAAINAAQSSSNGLLVIPAGVKCAVSGQLSVTLPLTIWGYGATITHPQTNASLWNLFAQTRIFGLTLDGVTRTFSTANIGISLLNGSAGSQIVHCTFKNLGRGIYSNGGTITDILIFDNDFINLDDGILWTVTGSQVTDYSRYRHLYNRFNHTISAAILMDPESDAATVKSGQIIGNYIFQIDSGAGAAGGYGIGIAGQLNGGVVNHQDVLIANNVIDCGGTPGSGTFGGHQGIHVEFARRITIEHNLVENCGYSSADAIADGIVIIPSHASIVQIHTIDNHVRNSARRGISYDSNQPVVGSLIEGNETEFNQSTGLYVAAGGIRKGTNISGNISRNNGRNTGLAANQRAGFVLDSPENGVIIASNTAEDDQPTPTQQYGFLFTSGSGGAQDFSIVGNNAYNNATANWFYGSAPGFAWNVQGNLGGALNAISAKGYTSVGSVTADLAQGSYITVLLRANTTMAVPSNPYVGQLVTFEMLQDGTGGRTVKWTGGAGGFTLVWSDAGNIANKRSTVTFRYDGTNLRQVGAQSPYY